MERVVGGALWATTCLPSACSWLLLPLSSHPHPQVQSPAPWDLSGLSLLFLGPQDSFFIAEEPGSSLASSLLGPVTSRKLLSPLRISLRWDAVWYVLLLLLFWLVPWIGLGVPSGVSSNQLGSRWACCVGVLMSWPLVGEAWG